MLKSDFKLVFEHWKSVVSNMIQKLDYVDQFEAEFKLGLELELNCLSNLTSLFLTTSFIRSMGVIHIKSINYFFFSITFLIISVSCHVFRQRIAQIFSGEFSASIRMKSVIRITQKINLD